MELRQLEYFVAVTEEANFTRAAARLHVAQPGVSAQIRQLERELGHALLDRSARTVRLTEAGAAVLPYARAALRAVAGARVAVDELAGLLRGHVSLGTVAVGGPINLADRLADFHQEHPGIEITLTENTSDRLVAGLAAGQLDLALVGLADADPPGLAIEIIADQPLVAVVGQDHCLAGRPAVKLKDLADLALMTLPAGSGIRTALDTGFAAVGRRPRIAFEASDPTVLTRLADRGLGIAILPAAENQGSRPGRLREIAITHPQLRTRLAVAWRAAAPAGPATTALIRHIARAKGPVT
jgi:DNA-binding transcriptional LysR family regulator